MSPRVTLPSGAIGTLTYKPANDQRLIPRTLQFIREQLPHWRDDPDRPEAVNEKQLNSQLADFLDARARREFSMVRFKHEQPQGNKRTVDIAAHPGDETTWVGNRRHSIYDPFLVLEAKRLPAPTSDREREYVVGAKEKSGGIERFKLGLHGATVEDGAMVGYVESRSLSEWHVAINSWIAAQEENTGRHNWSRADLLGTLREESAMGMAEADSTHHRTLSRTGSIRLRHFWIKMRTPANLRH